MTMACPRNQTLHPSPAVILQRPVNVRRPPSLNGIAALEQSVLGEEGQAAPRCSQAASGQPQGDVHMNAYRIDVPIRAAGCLEHTSASHTQHEVREALDHLRSSLSVQTAEREPPSALRDGNPGLLPARAPMIENV